MHCLADAVSKMDFDLVRKYLLDNRLVLVGHLFHMALEDDWSRIAEDLVTGAPPHIFLLFSRLKSCFSSVFEKNHRSIRLMQWALRKEVASTSHENELFRLDSAASKLMVPTCAGSEVPSCLTCCRFRAPMRN